MTPIQTFCAVGVVIVTSISICHWNGRRNVELTNEREEVLFERVIISNTAKTSPLFYEE